MGTRRPPGEPRRVFWLFPDYGTDWPLWENTSAWREVEERPLEALLPHSLVSDLRDWYTLWEREFSPTRAWSSGTNESLWLTRGTEIADRLRAEIGEWADVKYDGQPC